MITDPMNKRHHLPVKTLLAFSHRAPLSAALLLDTAATHSLTHSMNVLLLLFVTLTLTLLFSFFVVLPDTVFKQPSNPPTGTAFLSK
jgi:hypothetical protein